MGMENYNLLQEFWLVILYQDDYIMVVNKLSGLLLVLGCLEEYKDSVMMCIQCDYLQVELVYCLDMVISGVIVVVLIKVVEWELKCQFCECELKKQYVVCVWGYLFFVEGLVDLLLICDWLNCLKQKVCYEMGKFVQMEYEVVEYVVDNMVRVVLKLIIGCLY